MQTKLTKIGVFYDGNYFLHISNYYNYNHSKKNRISISGLHEFICSQAAKMEETKKNLCQIVDAHYFRGRLNAQEASQKGNLLYYDRVFDDILMSEGVITHYLPVKTYFGNKQDREINVWLAMEAFELAIYKRFDVIVLIASDGDYVPLVRKLNSLGTRVMILSWDFEFVNDEGQRVVTKTSQDLIKEVSYPISMHEMIDNGLLDEDEMISKLFVQSSTSKFMLNKVNEDIMPEGTEKHYGNILSLKTGFGFIKYPPNNLFFHYGNLVETDFNDLKEGDPVEFVITYNEKGEMVARDVRTIEEDIDGNINGNILLDDE
ncbi:MAG: cold-shock protein [Bacteroidetes bacterium HGW-Bacteroidetes-21]|nr:MAG: cold-shock protein [Bacteroidetes bacterium HGW-Bacteroidetes-21]